MKQFTTQEQTSKLIELGFDTPRNFFESLAFADKSRCAYSIGELIEMLPKTIEHEIWWGIEKGEKGYWGLRIDTDCTEYSGL